MDRKEIDDLIPGYLSGELTDRDRVLLEEWRKKDPANEKHFKEIKTIWDAIPRLDAMEHFDPFKALNQVNAKIDRRTSAFWLKKFQKIAAILLLPLLVFSAYQGYQGLKPDQHEMIWQTYVTPPGTKAKFILPDGSVAWLNSASEISFPARFPKNYRLVRLSGEACFEVTKQNYQAFYVETGNLNVKVLGTRFNVINYQNESSTEIILENGKVSLGTGTDRQFKEIALLEPGQAGLFDRTSKTLSVKKVDPLKYTSWIEGKLIFRDDTMNEVVRKLNRSFNVNIEVNDPEILNYVYTATFQDESIDQILELLSISAPINYRIIPREKQDGGLYSNKRIILLKR